MRPSIQKFVQYVDILNQILLSESSASSQAYFSAASELHARQIKALLSQYSGMIKRVDEEPEHSGATSGLRRAGTVVRSPLESRKEKEKAPNGTMRPSEVS